MEWLSERETQREREKRGREGEGREKERAKKRQRRGKEKGASALREWMWLRSSLSFLKTSKSPELAGYHHLLPMTGPGRLPK
jgi:hypothetical protein